MKCEAFSEYYSRPGRCYVIYEDGKFASSAAEQAVLR